jgi:hypothetical protein
MVVTTTSGESQAIDRGLYMVRGYGEEYFFPTWIAT